MSTTSHVSVSFFLASILVFALQAHPENNDNLVPFISFHNPSALMQMTSQALATLRDLKQVKLQHTQFVLKENCVLCNRPCVIQQDGAYCTDDHHERNVVIFYGGLFADSVITGAHNYLFLHYLYSLGMLKASAQVGINIMSNMVARQIPTEKITQPLSKEPVINPLLALLIKRCFKYGCLHCLGMKRSFLLEPHKMRSLFAGTITHQTCTRAQDFIHTAQYDHLSGLTLDAKRHDSIPNLLKVLGIIVGIYVAREFIEQPLHLCAKFLTEQTKTLGPEILKQMVSFTK